MKCSDYIVERFGAMLPCGEDGIKALDDQVTALFETADPEDDRSAVLFGAEPLAQNLFDLACVLSAALTLAGFEGLQIRNYYIEGRQEDLITALTGPVMLDKRPDDIEPPDWLAICRLLKQHAVNDRAV